MDNSKKLFFLKDSKGKFLDKHLAKVNKLSYAVYSTNEKEAESQLIQVEKLLQEKLFIHKSTETEFIYDMNDVIVSTIISGQHFIDRLNIVKFQIPTFSTINKNTKNQVTKTIDSLSEITSYFKDIEKKEDDKLNDVSACYQIAMENLSKIPLHKFGDLNNLIVDNNYFLD